MSTSVVRCSYARVSISTTGKSKKGYSTSWSLIWCKFFERHRLSLRNRTSVSQKLPRQLEGVLTKFYEDAGRFMRIGKYPRSLVENMDETPAFFDMVPSKSICKTGSKECIVRTSGCEKKHVTIVLSATADMVKCCLP